MSSQAVARVEFDADTQAFQRYIGEFRRFWAGPLYRRLRDDAARLAYDHSAADFDRSLHDLPAHQFFGSLEYNLQRLKYSSHWGIVPAVGRQRERLEREIESFLPRDRVTENPPLRMPDYYEENDFHAHPGGLRHDPIAAVIYRESAGATGGVVSKHELHQRFAREVLSRGKPKRVLDIGCGFGRSAFAFAAADSNIEVVGVDLSPSCVRLAACVSNERPEGARTRFIQADGTSIPLPDGRFDLVTSTMLLHELPPDAIRGVIAESHRLLAPKGAAAHLDFLPPNDRFLKALYYGHSERNAEPFMRTLAEMDLAADHKAAGFAAYETLDFAEDDQPRGETWRLPWTIIRATKS
jgi:ubiquinone/menaquinone biosynthesis C-methylase UbiE